MVVKHFGVAVIKVAWVDVSLLKYFNEVLHHLGVEFGGEQVLNNPLLLVGLGPGSTCYAIVIMS